MAARLGRLIKTPGTKCIHLSEKLTEGFKFLTSGNLKHQSLGGLLPIQDNANVK